MDLRRNVFLTRTGPSCLIALALAGTPALAVDPPDSDSYLATRAFAAPELYLGTSNEPLGAILDEMPNKAAWQQFRFAKAKHDMQIFIDRRSGAASNIIGSFPILPERGIGVKAADSPGTVLAAVKQFIHDNQGVLGVNISQLGAGRAVQVTPDMWQVTIPQVYQGIEVRYGRVAVSVKFGSIMLIGTEAWYNVPNGTQVHPGLNAGDALAAGFDHAGGRAESDRVVRQPVLELVPIALDSPGVGQGFDHVLAWDYAFVREGEGATWGITVNALTGEVLEMNDENQYADAQVVGGVYPLASTEICPTPQTCGTLQTGWPMPFADTGIGGFTDSGGIFDYTSGTATTTLSGQFVNINDNCGGVSENAQGSIDMGGVNGDHDCDSPGSSNGNTASARSAFYELNKLAEQARGWLPGNAWLQNQLTANVNLNNTCNAFWNGSTVNFYRAGGGCRNTGESAGVFDHEWGHGLDANDANGSLSNSSEGYADIAAIYRLQTSCVGHGFFWTSDRGCGTTADGTGFNANERQTGGTHCDLDCSGVRDADWDKHADHTPDTPVNFVCPACNTSSGPCGRQVHCAAAPVRQAAWDLVARDLPAAGFNSETSFMIGNKLFLQGSGNVGLWYSCNCGGGTSDGCGAASGYMQWLVADDDDNNLGNGTPHMAEIFAAFDRHGIACSTPTPTSSNCGAPATPTLSASADPGATSVSLSWNDTGASNYWVLRTEGVAGCDFGKALIAEVNGTSFTDNSVGGARDYHYNVVAASSSECFSATSACQSVTTDPLAPPPPPPPCDLAQEGESCNRDNDCCSNSCSKGKPSTRVCLP